MNRNRPPVSVVGVLIMGGTLGAQILTVIAGLFTVAYFEPGFLTFLSSIKSPYLGEIMGVWVIVLSLWALIKSTFIVGKAANSLLAQVFSRWTRSSPESS